MCRLLGYVSRTPVTLADLLGEGALREFTELSVTHGDGWGFAWCETGTIAFDKATGSARSSEAFTQLTRQRPSEIGVAHLRLATLGLDVTHENTHPFTDGRIAFAHNGSVSPPASLNHLVPPDLAPLRAGSTDSERYFLAVLGASRETEGDLPAAVALTVSRIAARLRFGGLNAMLATPDQLIAVCRYDPVAEQREPAPDYYQLRYRATADAVIVSSSGWGEGWKAVANGEMIVVDRRTLTVTVTALDEPRAA